MNKCIIKFYHTQVSSLNKPSSYKGSKQNLGRSDQNFDLSLLKIETFIKEIEGIYTENCDEFREQTVSKLFNWGKHIMYESLHIILQSHHTVNSTVRGLAHWDYHIWCGDLIWYCLPLGSILSYILLLSIERHLLLWALKPDECRTICTVQPCSPDKSQYLSLNAFCHMHRIKILINLTVLNNRLKLIFVSVLTSHRYQHDFENLCCNY